MQKSSANIIRILASIIIYDNNHDGEEDLVDVLYNQIHDGLVDVVNVRNQERFQFAAYNHCYKNYGKNYDWILFVDFDEFLVINDGNIKSLVERYNGFDCVLFNWMIMTDSGQIFNTCRPLMERFTVPMQYDKHVRL